MNSIVETASVLLVGSSGSCLYSGAKNQENCGSRPTWANSSLDPISKIPTTKQDWWKGSSVRAPP
jgi:hypothetical protein